MVFNIPNRYDMVVLRLKKQKIITIKPSYMTKLKIIFVWEKKYPLLRINHKTKCSDYNIIIKKFILENILN